MTSIVPLPGSSGRRAKIVCTIGPACDSEECIADLMRLGMDVARLNFSHGTHPEHARRIQRMRSAARKLKRTICILQDLQGPKIRTGRLKDGKPVELKRGSLLTITPREVAGKRGACFDRFFRAGARSRTGRSRTFVGWPDRTQGLQGATAEMSNARSSTAACSAEHQGINLPGAAIAIPALTDKDKLDLQFGLKHGVDAVALSFVRSADDIGMARNLMRGFGKSVPIVAKLEKPQAIDNLEEILEAAHGVMIARGDLGRRTAARKSPHHSEAGDSARRARGASRSLPQPRCSNQ